MRPIIYPYKLGSRGAKALADELKSRGHKALRVKPDGKYKPYNNHLILNWGNSTIPQWLPNEIGGIILNHFALVRTAGNKLTAFNQFKEAGNVSIPEFTAVEEEAQQWADNGIGLMARTKLTGHSGEGIHYYEGIANEQVDIYPNAPLYVKYIKKQKEFRVHVFKGQVIDIQEKRKRKEVPNEEIDYKVRNHANGWVYCRSDVAPHQSVVDNAINAINALNLDFGAVDVVWNEYHSQAYVLEVNTAPGLEGTTLSIYANKIEELL